jgi:hypothetical protein
MATSGLLQWQVGKETTWGTSVAGTAKLMGVQSGNIQADNRSAIYRDMRGSLQPGHLAGLEQKAGVGSMEVLATFEDLPYILDSACTEATPTGTGPYVYTYAAPTTAVPTNPRKLTVIHGSSQTGAGVYKLEGGLVNSFTIKGATGKPTSISVELIGKDVVSGTLAAVSDRTVEVIMGQPWAIYYDVVGGTIGTTALATTAVAFELKINCNRVLVWSMDSLLPDGFEEGPRDASLSLTLRYNATVKTEVDALAAQTAVVEKQIRLKQTSGTKIAQFDFAGIIAKPPATFEDADGVLTSKLDFTSKYNTALANCFAASISNSVASLV